MNTKGFAIAEIVVVVVVVAIVAASAYLLWMRPSSQESTDTTPASYQTEQDLESASNELEDTNIDAELDAELQKIDQEAAAF